jgi:SAM-dependent methyltransferase
MLDNLQYRILRKISPLDPQIMSELNYEGQSKVKVSLGDDLLNTVRGKTVIDFGCGDGVATLDLARAGARRVIGLDILEKSLQKASKNAEKEGFGSICKFTTSTSERADVIVSLDAFEHFSDPAAILETMHGLLKPGGVVMTSFGPTWYHPLGGHLFSVFPWAHLVFSESALVRWRAHLRSDKATRFSEVEGGLNQMTIARFERLVRASRFKLENLETVPIRALRRVHCRLTREFTTSVVRARLVPEIGGLRAL